ncbi:MAG: hypothetical protein M3067_01095 [Chloroflexota bacterium]|nr:hypothetical protein [Chloroflexota bacterium]
MIVVPMAKLILALLALIAVSCGPLPVSGGQAASPPANLFSYSSDYGDYIGLGRSDSFMAANSKFIVEPGTTPDWLQLVVERGDSYWSIDLAAPSGHPLQVGTYENATRLGARNEKTPVLMIYGDGRGCNESTGSFTIKQIAFDQHGRLVALQATFVQRCEAPTTGDFHGTIAYGRSQ